MDCDLAEVGLLEADLSQRSQVILPDIRDRARRSSRDVEGSDSDCSLFQLVWHSHHRIAQFTLGIALLVLAVHALSQPRAPRVAREGKEHQRLVVRGVGRVQEQTLLQADEESHSCHTARPPELCFRKVAWAWFTGILQHKDWYGNLSAQSTFVDFQAHLHSEGYGHCPQPCQGPGPSQQEVAAALARATDQLDSTFRSSSVTAPSGGSRRERGDTSMQDDTGGKAVKAVSRVEEPLADGHMEQMIQALEAVGPTGPCLCLFDVDRTLTGKQGFASHCPGNLEIPGVEDDAFSGGPLTLSPLGVGIRETFCSDCNLGIVSAGSAGGPAMKQALQENMPGLGSVWSTPSKVVSPLLVGCLDGIKPQCAKSIVDWFKAAKEITIEPRNVFFFDDHNGNTAGFVKFGYNARQVSCAKRDKSWGDTIGLCGGQLGEIIANLGMNNCA